MYDQLSFCKFNNIEETNKVICWYRTLFVWTSMVNPCLPTFLRLLHWLYLIIKLLSHLWIRYNQIFVRRRSRMTSREFFEATLSPSGAWHIRPHFPWCKLAPDHRLRISNDLKYLLYTGWVALVIGCLEKGAGCFPTSYAIQNRRQKVFNRGLCVYLGGLRL